MLAIVKTENNRVAIYQRFDDPAQAQAHVDKFGGFVYAGEYSNDLFIADDGTVSQVSRVTPEQLQAAKNAEARAYLASTDWYVIRKTETGVEIPADILAARQAARDSVA